MNNSMEDSKQQVLAVISHLGGLVPISFLPIIIPLVIWIFFGDKGDFINRQSKEALNFQLSLVIYSFGCWILFVTVIGIPVAAIAVIVFIAVNFVCSIVAAVKTSKGQPYRYPMNLRLIR